MKPHEKAQAVRAVFADLQIKTDQYLKQSQLTCYTGCGLCCANPKVSASVLEFLPLAMDIFLSGKADETMDILESSTEDSFCFLFKNMSTDTDVHSGYCTNYPARGLICRLFGSSARTNKSGQKELVICKKLKEGKKEKFDTINEAINNDLEIPVSRDYYTQLYQIDFQLAHEQYPINKAIQKALEAVMMYYHYSEGEAI